MGDRVKQQIAELSEHLNLTEEQKKAIGPIIEKEMKEIQALRADTTLSKEEKIEKMKAIRQTAQEEMNKVLTPEQQEKLAEAKEEMKEETKENVAANGTATDGGNEREAGAIGRAEAENPTDS